jgi:subtilisin
MTRPPFALPVVLLVAALILATAGATDASGKSGDYIVRYKDAAVSVTVTERQRVARSGASIRRLVDRDKVARRIRSARSAGIKPARVFRHAIGGFSARLTASQVRRLRADPTVASVELDAPLSVERDRVEGSVVSRGSISPQRIPTGIKRIYADKQPLAHIGSRTTTDVDIAVVDTGIAAHPDLRIAGGVNCTGSGGTSTNDVYGHGTHVAGIIAARDNTLGIVGVVPGARLWAIKSMNDQGRGTTSSIVCGLDWMIGQQLTAGGPRFIAANMSIAGPLEYPNRACGAGTGDAYHAAICAGMDVGIVFAVAAANDRRVVNQRPAIYDEPITVGALADFDGRPGGRGRQADICPWYSRDVDDTYADFSNWGAAVDIIAPGKCILSTYTRGRYAWMSGTSMATPYVAGAIALYRMRYPQAMPQQVKQALVSAGTLSWRTGSSPDGRKYRLLQVKTLTTPPTIGISAGTGLLGGEGTRRGISVSIARKSGHYRPVRVTASSTPAGVGSETLRVAQGGRSGTLVLLGSDELVTGTYDVRVRATDGELSATTTVRVKVDATPPEATVTSPAAGTTVILTRDSTRIATEASDADSGVASRTLRRRAATPTGLMSCDGATFSNDGAAVRVTGTGPFTVSIPRSGTCYQWVLTATDKAGNPTSARSGSVWIDTSGPMTPTLSTRGDAGVRGSTIWFRDDASGSFTLSAVSRDPQSGIDSLSIGRISGSGWTTGGSTPLAVDEAARTGSRSRDFEFTGNAGPSTLSLTAIDGVGRRRVTNVSVRADGDTPTLSVVSPTSQRWLGTDAATIRFDAADASSGIGRVSARQERAPLRSKAAGCSGVSWAADGSIDDVRSDRFTATGLERDTCYRWVITASDRVGHQRSRTTPPVAIDPTEPVVDDLTVDVARRQVSSSGTIPVTASWALRRAPVGTTTYELDRTVDGGASWQTLESTARSRSAATSVRGGRATTLAVRARSSTGARSAWTTSARVTARLAQEDASAVSRSSGWRRVRIDDASAGYRLQSTKSGARVTYRFSGRSIALVAARGKLLGQADILIDGKRVATIDLKARTQLHRQIVWARRVSSGEHTITIRVRKGTVVVDGFVVTQSATGSAR